MKSLRLLLFLFALPFLSSAQFKIPDVMKDVQSATKGKKKLSNEDIISGLKEALTVGTNNSTGSASKVDGYLKNPAI
jgi:hypothetical protein